MRRRQGIDPRDDVDIARHRTIDEMKLVAGVPDVLTGSIDDEGAIRKTGTSRQLRTADIRRGPGQWKRLRVEQIAVDEETESYQERGASRECRRADHFVLVDWSIRRGRRVWRMNQQTICRSRWMRWSESQGKSIVE